MQAARAWQREQTQQTTLRQAKVKGRVLTEEELDETEAFRKRLVNEKDDSMWVWCYGKA